VCEERCLVLLVRNPPFEIANSKCKSMKMSLLVSQVEGDGAEFGDRRRSGTPLAQILAVRNILQIKFCRVSMGSWRNG
jgi:hypothetical protein